MHHAQVFIGRFHASEIFLIPHSLKISGNHKQVDGLSLLLEHFAHPVVVVQLSVSTSRNSDVDRRHGKKNELVTTNK